MAKGDTTITIQYTYDPAAGSPCKASTTFAGEALNAYGASWAEAKQNLITMCQQHAALGAVPESEEVDLEAL